MSKKKDVKFQHRERRLSRSSDLNSDSPTDGRSPTRTDGLKTSNGSIKSSQERAERPGIDRTDTGLTADWATDDEKPPVKTVSDFEKKKQTFITRAIWTFVMIGGFFGAMFAGHLYVIMVVTAIQIISFKEVIAISNVPSRARSLRFTKTLNWYFLGITMYFLYGESVIYYFKHIILVDRILLPFATHHRFISFMLYVMGKTGLVRSNLR